MGALLLALAKLIYYFIPSNTVYKRAAFLLLSSKINISPLTLINYSWCLMKKSTFWRLKLSR